MPKVQRADQVAADADVAPVDLYLQLGGFVPVAGRAAQGRGQQQEPQGLAVQWEDSQPGAYQQRPQLVGAGMLADGVEAPVQDALAGFQRSQQPSQAFCCFPGLLRQVVGLGLGQGVQQILQDGRVLAYQQLHRKVQGVQGTGEGPQLRFVQLQPHHLQHRQLHPVQTHRAVVFQVGQHEKQGQGRRLGFLQDRLRRFFPRTAFDDCLDVR